MCKFPQEDPWLPWFLGLSACAPWKVSATCRFDKDGNDGKMIETSWISWRLGISWEYHFMMGYIKKNVSPFRSIVMWNCAKSIIISGLLDCGVSDLVVTVLVEPPVVVGQLISRGPIYRQPPQPTDQRSCENGKKVPPFAVKCQGERQIRRRPWNHLKQLQLFATLIGFGFLWNAHNDHGFTWFLILSVKSIMFLSH